MLVIGIAGLEYWCECGKQFKGHTQSAITRHKNSFQHIAFINEEIRKQKRRHKELLIELERTLNKIISKK